MKIKRKLLALLLALSILAALTGCTQSVTPEASPEASPEQSAAPSETASAESESPAQGEEEPLPETTVDEAPKAISYPIPGEHTLTMVQNLMNHASAVLGDGDYSDQYCYKTIEEKTGVKIEFHMIGEAAYSEQLNLLIASQDYPDIFGQGIGSYDDNPIKAIEDDVVIDFADLIAENAPDYAAILEANSDYADSVYNTDGSLCRMTSCNIGTQTQGMYIRGDWLEKLGLSEPKTIDELTEVLRAFKTEFDPSMALLVNTDLDDGLANSFNHSMIGFTRQMLGFQLTEPDSGVVISTVASEGYIEHLTLLRQYFEEGLICDDFLNISKENGNFESSYYSGVCGLWQDGCEVADPSYAKNSNDPDWQALPILAPKVEGRVNHMSSFSEFTGGMSYMYISTACEIPEIALQYINYGFTEEGMDLIAFGIEGETYNVAEDGSVSYGELLTGHPDGIRTAEWLYLCSGWFPTRQQERAVFMRFTNKLSQDAIKMWTEDAKDGDDSMVVPRKATLTSDEQDIVSTRRGDICTHFAEASAKYIMGDISEAEYRDSIETANTLGLDEVTAIYQASYDRYMEANK